MAAGPYPNLGFDPCPGDLGGYQALAAYASRSATTLTSAVSTLAAAGSQEWRGQAADAFRAHVHEDVLPLARTASGSVGRAATALHNWALTLGSLQDEANSLDRQAEPYRTDLEAALRAAGLPANAAPPYSAKLTSAQTARVNAANTGLAAILAKANDVHTRYLDAVRAANSQLDNAGNMAPHPPGLFSSLWHDATSLWDTAARGLDEFVHDKALLQFISGMANVVATVAGLLALFPPLTLVFGPIALSAAVLAMGADALLAGFDHGTWGAVILDAISVAADAGWMKAASKLAAIYKDSGLVKSMTETRTLTGLVTGKKAYVAPGMFRMIGDSLKAAAGGTNATAEELARVKDFNGYGVWRAVDITAGQLSWSTAFAGIEAIPGNVRTWVNDGLTGKTPWQESANQSTGL
jgi:hypothetical protein